MVAIQTGDPRAWEEQAIQDMQTRGWIEVEETAIGFVNGLFDAPTSAGWRRPSLEAILRELRTDPVSLSRTLLGNAEVEAVMPSGQLFEQGYTGLTRLLVHSDFGRLVFVENEYVLTGERIHIYCAELHHQLNGMPMVHYVKKGPSGASTTSFLWFTETREYQFYLDRAVLRGDTLHELVVRNLIDRVP